MKKFDAFIKEDRLESEPTDPYKNRREVLEKLMKFISKKSNIQADSTMFRVSSEINSNDELVSSIVFSLDIRDTSFFNLKDRNKPDDFLNGLDQIKNRISDIIDILSSYNLYDITLNKSGDLIQFEIYVEKIYFEENKDLLNNVTKIKKYNL